MLWGRIMALQTQPVYGVILGPIFSSFRFISKEHIFSKVFEAVRVFMSSFMSRVVVL